MPEKIIQRGAEALIILDKGNIIKRRIKKSYRLPILDKKIRGQRTRSEKKLLEKSLTLIPVPKLEKDNYKDEEISMEFIDGKRVSESLDTFPLTKQKKICKTIGSQVTKLHDKDIIHGDLTTSNMILRGSEIFFIDFGLGFISQRPEDKAVDLHVLRQALEAKHFKHWQVLFAEVLKGYSSSKNSKKVLEQFKKVEARGRYKENY